MVGNTFVFKSGEMIIKYAGEETINGIPCRKYEHRTQGLLAKLFGGAGLHLAGEGRSPAFYSKVHLEVVAESKMENFSLQLQENRKMEPEEWEVFVQELVAEANRFFGMD